MKKFIYVLLVVLFGLTTNGQAEYHYFDFTNGSDLNGGTSLVDAWKTMGKANSECNSGDTCYFASEETWSGTGTILTANPGVIYDGSTHGSGTRARLLSTANGSSSSILAVDILVSNVIFRGFEVDGNGYAIGGINIGHSITTGNISDITIDDCVVHNGRTDDSGSEVVWYYGILVGNRSDSETSDVTIINCHVYEMGHEGITIYPSWQSEHNSVDTVLVRNCVVHDTGQAGGDGRHGIDVGLRSSNVTIEYCTIYNVLYGAFYVVTYSETTDYGSPDNVIFRYNLIYDSPTGIGMVIGSKSWWTGDNEFYGNILINSSIFLGGGDYNSTSQKFYNNTIYMEPGSTRVGFTLYDNATEATGVELKNNIIYTGNSFCVYDYTPAGMVHNNNLLLRNSDEGHTHVRTYDGSFVDYNREEVNTATGDGPYELTAQKTDPTFAGGTLPTGFSGTYGTDMIPNQTYFAISSGDALNNGETLGSPYNGCINGAGLADPLYRAIAYDIGAYEYDPISLAPTSTTPTTCPSGN